jgi:hypothetical protein
MSPLLLIALLLIALVLSLSVLRALVLSASRPVTMRRSILLVIAALLPSLLTVSVQSAVAHPSDTLSVGSGSYSAEKGSTASWLLLPSVFTTPETGFAGGAVAIRLFSLPGNERTTPTSQVMTTLIYTEKRQLMASIIPQLFIGDDRYRIDGYAEYVHFPDTYYGVGNDVPSDGETYTRTNAGLGVRALARISHGIYVGPRLMLLHQRLSDFEADGIVGAAPGRTGGFITEVGPRLVVDRREHPASPRHGYYAELSAALATRALGSDYSFHRFEADLRAFVPVRSRGVLGLHAYTALAPGDVPFTLMPQLGGDAIMRGHFSGRFRDRAYSAVQAEYRFPIWWRVGAATFASAGQVASSFQDQFRAPIRWAAGGGMRFALSREERLNVRIDYGIGPGTSSLYVTLGEAF